MTAESVAWAKRTAFGSPTKKLIMLVVADACDTEWSCFPGQATLARQTELGERTVRRLLAELEADGWLRREHRHRANGSRTSDRIFLVPSGPATGAGCPPADPDRLPANHISPTGQPLSDQPATGAGPPEPPVEPPVEPPAVVTPRDQLTLVPEVLPAPPAGVVLGGDRDVWFDRWWRSYPRRASKGAARTAWARARKKGIPAEVLVRAAEAYAADPNRLDEFTKLPATWLNQECWEDGPLPERGTEVRTPTTAMGATTAGFAKLDAAIGAARSASPAGLGFTPPPRRQLGAGE